jgi:hypothetical protein
VPHTKYDFTIVNRDLPKVRYGTTASAYSWLRGPVPPRFVHVGGRESFLHGGRPGSFDSKFQWLMPSPILRADLGEVWYYYGGLNRDHAGRVGARHTKNSRGDLSAKTERQRLPTH